LFRFCLYFNFIFLFRLSFIFHYRSFFV
jgi:hypothetical protein